MNHEEPGTRATIGSTILVALLGYYSVSSPTLLPALVSEWIVSVDISEGQAGFVAAGCLICQTVGMLIGMVALRSRSLAWIASAGLILAMLGDGLSVFASAYGQLLTVRAVNGFGTGLLLATIVNWFSRQRNPSRGFAIFVTLQFMMPLPIILLLPRVEGLLGSNAIYITLLTIAAISLPAIRPLGRLPVVRSGTQPSRFAPGSGPKTALMVMAVGSSVLFAACVVGAWAFLLPYAVRSGIDSQSGMQAIAVSSACGVPGSLLVATLGPRLGRTAPIAIGLIGLSILFVWFGLAVPSQSVFYVQVALLNFIWAFSSPLIQDAQAAMDDKGVLPVWGSIGGSVGSGLGPGILGQLIGSDSFTAAFLVAAAGMATAAALILPVALSLRYRTPA